MATPPRTPLRNVPTLTQVVHPAALVTPRPAPNAAAAPAGLASAAPAHPAAGAEAVSVARIAEEPAPAQDALVQQMMRAVLADANARIEYRLRQTLTKVVAEHTARMVPLLQQELESMVRECVGQALQAHDVRTRR